MLRLPRCLALLLLAATARAQTAPPPEPAAAVGAKSSPRDRLLVELGAGGRVGFGLPDGFEPRVALMLSYFPRQLRKRFGVALGLRAGSGLQISGPIFDGRYDDVIISFQLRSQIRFPGRFALEPLAGIGAHATILDADLPQAGQHARVVRGICALEAGAALGLELSSGAQLSLVVILSYLTQTQRYLVGGVPVIEAYPLELDVGLRLRAGVW